jgi:hypothetical protein
VRAVSGHGERKAADVRGPAIRALDESANPRGYWRDVHEDGSEWLFETVEDDRTAWVVKQIVVDAVGAVHRYAWDNLEDEDGFLTDQPLDPARDPITAIDAGEFFQRWRD